MIRERYGLSAGFPKTEIVADCRNDTDMKILISGAGTLVKKSREHGIATPCNAMMGDRIKCRESLAAQERL